MNENETEKSERKTIEPHQRELIVAYLTYALDDVRALSEVGLHLLQLAIATITDEVAADESDAAAPVARYH
jgi:hypothetical protein